MQDNLETPAPLILAGQRCLGLHPVVWLAGWVSVIVLLQHLAPIWRLVSLGVFLLCFCFTGFSRFFLLCRRSGFLLLMTGVMLAWRTPGMTVVSTADTFWFRWLPTYEGLTLALYHVIGLVVFLAAAALYLSVLNRCQVLIGLYRLLCWIPFVDAKRWTVRFFLVLEGVSESRSEWSLRYFYRLLDTAVPMQSFPESMLLMEPGIRVIDRIIVVCMTIGNIMIVYWG